HGEDTVHTDALCEVVGGHRQGQGGQCAFARRVQRPFGKACWCGDAARVDDRGLTCATRLAQVGQRGAHSANRPESVDVQDSVPFGVVVVGNGAACPDPGVVDEYVQSPPVSSGQGHGGAYRGVVGHVTVYGEVAVGLGTYVPGWGGKVQAHHGGTTGGEQPGRGQADAGGGTGDQGTYTREVGHVDTSPVSRHTLP